MTTVALVFLIRSNWWNKFKIWHHVLRNGCKETLLQTPLWCEMKAVSPTFRFPNPVSPQVFFSGRKLLRDCWTITVQSMPRLRHGFQAANIPAPCTCNLYLFRSELYTSYSLRMHWHKSITVHVGWPPMPPKVRIFKSPGNQVVLRPKMISGRHKGVQRLSFAARHIDAF